jgi:CHAD domain-containing protein
MRRTLERELKLVPGEGFRLSELGETRFQNFMSTYHDTSDLRLARSRITLRFRAENGSRLWQLKIPTGAARIELELPGLPAHPPEEMIDLLAVHLRDEPLVKIARLRTRRESVHRDGAEIVEDAVAVFEGQRIVRRFRELEVELIDGDERSLKRLEGALLAAGAERGEFVPKLHRALDIPFDGAPRRPGPDAATGEALGLALATQRQALIDHDPGTRLGMDAEDLHQMRVATRRARAYLRAAREVLEPAWAKELRAELGWLGSALGPARDADVLEAHLRDAVGKLGKHAEGAGELLPSLEAEREEARRSAVAALSDDRYFALLDRLAEQPRLVEAEADTRLADLWWKEFNRTRRAFRRLDAASPGEELHDARIHVKRSRYAAEVAAHELGEAGERFVDASKKLQDVLGEHQDSVVAQEWIAAWASSRPEAESPAAELIDGERKRRKRARRKWPRAWEKLARRARDARS